MKKTGIVLLISIVFTFFSCKENVTTTKISPYDDLARIDMMLESISAEPQIYFVPSDISTLVLGDNGTIIHVDPSILETLDGAPVGDTIEVELVEFTDMYSLITNNIQTKSGGEILVTGGAYFINMTSNGKQLKISDGRGIKVEFPILSDNEMALFLGERDSLGQVNWIPTQQKFYSKNIEDPQRPEEPEQVDTLRIRYTAILEPLDEGYYLTDTISAPEEVRKEEVSEAEYQSYLKELELYKKKLQEIAYLRKTYQAIEILNFGWINCDRFYNNPNPKTDILLSFNTDSLKSARFFAVFDDINSVLSEAYWFNKNTTTRFIDIPIDMDIRIIGLTVKDSIPYWFNTEITTSLNQTVHVEFVETTQEQIKENLKSYVNR